MRFRGANPVFSRVRYETDYSNQASYFGIALKSMILLFVIMASAASIMFRVESLSGISMLGLLIIAPIIGFIMVLLVHTQPQIAPVYAFVYALVEGVFLGAITALVSTQVGKFGVNYALMGTMGTVFTMLLIYQTGLVRMGNRFIGFLFTSLVSLMVVSLLFYIVYIFVGLDSYFGFGIYATIVIVSTLLSVLYLLYDFQRIEDYVEQGASKDYEWSLSIGLLVTIVWLYIDLLRLVYIIMGRRR
jgi:uncharacterized YccA/Bax inhibitor family protein